MKYSWACLFVNNNLHIVSILTPDGHCSFSKRPAQPHNWMLLTRAHSLLDMIGFNVAQNFFKKNANKSTVDGCGAGQGLEVAAVRPELASAHQLRLENDKYC